MNNYKVEQEAAQMILNAINDNRITQEMIRDNEVHQEVFNTDYFLIGYYQAEQWILKNFDSVFTAIEEVKDYEMENFGEFNTDINSEKIAGMLSYIYGEYVLNELDSFENLTELKEALNEYID